MTMEHERTMTIEYERIDKSTVALKLFGRLDTANAPLLERKIKQQAEDITELVLDFAGLDYISSMGLRVLLQAKKTMKAEGRSLIIKNMCDSVREVFQMTGFLNLMVQEEKFVVIRKDEPECITLSFIGEMESDDIPDIAKELLAIRDGNSQKTIKVILDMEKLAYAYLSALKSLNQAIADSAWETRTLRIRNASVDVKKALDDAEMGKLVDYA
jgi:anti-sigma B factor antagonist